MRDKRDKNKIRLEKNHDRTSDRLVEEIFSTANIKER